MVQIIRDFISCKNNPDSTTCFEFIHECTPDILYITGIILRCFVLSSKFYIKNLFYVHLYISYVVKNVSRVSKLSFSFIFLIHKFSYLFNFIIELYEFLCFSQDLRSIVFLLQHRVLQSVVPLLRPLQIDKKITPSSIVKDKYSSLRCSNSDQFTFILQYFLLFCFRKVNNFINIIMKNLNLIST